ncbi:MAG: MarR family transcriptional regulator [Asticcacaulis sp.]
MMHDDSDHATATQLRVAIGRLIRRLREEAMLGDLTWPQVSALGRLEREGPATLSALARAEGVRSQSLGETVAALKAAGLVTGTPDPEDGRQTVLSVTDTARDLFAASRAKREDWLFRAMQARLTPAERDSLAQAATLMHRLLD